MNNTYLKIDSVCKSFGQTLVLDNVSFELNKGEFLSILGSSGSGKTTILRIISGLEQQDSGSIFLDGREISNLPPEKRELNMVFQSYALFEHMTIADNIAYSMKLKKIPRAERLERAEDMLKMLGLEGRGSDYPSQLSGGQRQRVAIGRAIINEPKMLLLDEPLGALDRNLRKRLQEELKALQKKIGISCIYITHDQEEALYLSDRIVILDKGHIVQIGSVDEITSSQLPFVREFLGAKQDLK